MNLQNPAALWWFLPLGGYVIVLYLLRMRRRDVRVPATFLWPDRVDEVRANSLFQRLKFNWLLLLQLLALSAIITSLARPQFIQSGLAGRVTVLVVDTSASMGATDVKPSRLDVAKRIARESVQAASVGDRIALIEAGPSARVVFPLSTDSASELRAFESLVQTDAESDLGSALRLAAAIVAGIDGARIVVLTDGATNPIKDFSPGKAALVYQRIGESEENLALTALGITETPKGRQLYCGVRNFGLKPRQSTVTIRADGKVIDSLRLDVADGKTWGHTLNAPPGAKVFEATLDAEDFLKADNYLATVADPGTSLKVLLVGPGDYFLERALALDPRVTLDKASRVPESESTGPGSYDIVVFDGAPEQLVKARGVLTFGNAGAVSPVVRVGGRAKLSSVISVKSPLLEGVDLDWVFADSIEAVKPRAASEVLAETATHPLIVTSKGQKRQIYVAFEPLKSDFPLHVGFPIFVANTLDFLAGEGSATDLAVRAGQVFSLPTSSPSLSLVKPDGKTEGITSNGGSAVIRNVLKIGKYGLKDEKQKRTVFASLRSDVESNIAPADRLQVGGAAVKTVASPQRFEDFWRPLVSACLVVLALEWWLYAKRS